MSIFISPGVFSKELDLSDVVPNVSSTSAGIVGYSVKGDAVNVRLFSTQKQFIEEYGKPVPGDFFHYSALAYLERGRTLWALRVINGALFGGVKIMQSDAVDANAALLVGSLTAAYEAVSGEDICFYVYGRDPGVWNANVAVRVENIDATYYEFDIVVYDENDVKLESWKVSRKTQKDGYGVQQYLESRINDSSRYIRVADNTNIADTVLPKAQAVSLALGGGSDGSAVSDSHVIAGWDNFGNPDELDVRALINGGYTSVNVQTKMLAVAEDRLDCIAILDIPYAELTSVASMVTWRSTTQNFNSSYCALYTPWVKQYDPYNDKVLDLPPSGFMAAVFAYNDFVGEPWDAPAGFRRGVLNVVGLTNTFTPPTYYNPTGERDTLYAAQINPIQIFYGAGTTIWGQKTMQTRGSATDRINVRRLLIVMEKSIAIFLASFVFQRNNASTRFQIKAQIDAFMDDLSAKGAFQVETGDKGYSVVCDSSNNSQASIDRNELYVDVYVKPVKTAEFVQLRTVITTTGASFDELTGVNFIL